MHDKRRGHPVGFGRNFFDQLSLLEGDVGAKSLLKAKAGQTLEVHVSDPGILEDIDEPSDIR